MGRLPALAYVECKNGILLNVESEELTRHSESSALGLGKGRQAAHGTLQMVARQNCDTRITVDRGPRL